MKKEGLSYIFNSRDGKVNLVLLFSIVLIFVLSMIYAEAISVVLYTPGNFTFNGSSGSRNVNFTFTVNWQATTDTISNCTLWVNSTTNEIVWSRQKVVDIAANGTAVQPDDLIRNATGTANNLSYANLTLTSDGNFTWSVGCFATNASGGALTFPTATNNFTVFVDTLPPTLTLGTPNGGLLADATGYNITSYDTAYFYINVSDNSTQYVWVVLNNNATITQAVGFGYSGGINESVNRSMTLQTNFGSGTKQYNFSLIPLFNFNSSFTGPGPHSVSFCANDTFGRLTCTNRSDYIIKGMNVTQMENIFATMQQGGAGGLGFGGLNITFGNGTEIPFGTFMNPITGVTDGGITHKNFTFIINFSSDIIIHIVAGKVDENQFANASNTRVNSTPTPEVRTQLGRYTSNMAWADISSFIPSSVSYLYGIIQIGGIGFSKKMYCNGTTMSDPQCHTISQCNSTVFGIYNYTSGQTSSSSGVIPANDACWLESGVINSQSLASGYTYIFVSHFSGGVGGDDRSQINVTFNGPLFNGFNTSTALNIINFTLEDINSTGLNLSLNLSINVSIYQTSGGAASQNFTYNNSGTTNLTCTTADAVSPQNTTSVTCNVTYTFPANGTYVINVTARDASNNSNPVNISTSSINITILTASLPVISLTGMASVATFGAVNSTNVTSSTGINFSATVVSTATLKNLSFTSDCNSTGGLFSANVSFKPFQGSCVGTAANRTIRVTAADFFGNNITNIFQFLVDDLGPSLAVWSPTQGGSFANNVSLNWSANDGLLYISFTGYYLDDKPVALLNFTAGAVAQGAAATNTSDSRAINFTPGTHTIKFTANDTLGNVVNSSAITFTATGPINFASLQLNTTLRSYNTNIALINLTNASGAPIYEVTSTVADQTLNLLMALNATPGTLVNVTLTFNASAANWDRYNFSVQQNDTVASAGISNNQSLNILQIVSFNNSINEFIQDAGYFGTVKFLLNASGVDIGSTAKFLWFENISNLKNPTNITQCSLTFAPTIAGVTSPCWNNTDNQSITIFVPHFSHIVYANNTPPTVTINTPASTQTVISFVPNITVSDDTFNCTYSYNQSGGGSTSQIVMTLAEQSVISTCVGSEITNLTNGTILNITFYVYDTSNNLNQTTLTSTLSDTTPQNISSISIGSISATGAVVTITSNESVNMSINSTGSNALTGSNYANVSTYKKTQSITLSSLTASTIYNLTVITCDRAGNCLTNTTLGFTTSAAPSSSSSGDGGGGGGGGGGSAGGAAPTINAVASAARQWDTLAAGASASLSIHNPDIAVTKVTIDVQNTVDNPSITVASLKSNPVSISASSKVYQYLQITAGNIAGADASKITVSFAVPKSWLTSNGVAKSDVVLWRYTDQWSQLPTTETGEDADSYIYQSTTPGFSAFAVGSKEVAPAVTPATVPTEPTAPTEPTSAPTAPQPAPAPTPIAAPKGISTPALAWIVVLIIVVVAVIGYFIWQKKKSEY